jgi:hypothetical protein
MLDPVHPSMQLSFASASLMPRRLPKNVMTLGI